MADESVENLLPRLSTRREYFDYLDRWAIGTVDELRAHKTTRALVKAFLLETSATNGSRDALAAFRSGGQEVSQVDDTLYRMRWLGDDGDWALVEVENERYPVVYTALESTLATRRVDKLIQTPLLDRAWFAAPLFVRLWEMILDAFPLHRFSQIVFEHESRYEVIADGFEVHSTSDDEEDDSLGENEEPIAEVERRRARGQIAERIGILKDVLPELKASYNPLESIIRLRFPAIPRGGHDIYFDGRFTNRSDSITSLRQTVAEVAKIYQQTTEKAEQATWPREPVAGVAQPVSLGDPLLIRFSDKLELTTFERWMQTLRRKNNRFRLWGNQIEMGPGKVHMYAVDNHLWQPIDLEITQDHLYALLSPGTCGNTIHRLVTNIQRFVDPKPEVFIGEKPYAEFIPRGQGE
jgi:hypothetical protein